MNASDEIREKKAYRKTRAIEGFRRALERSMPFITDALMDKRYVSVRGLHLNQIYEGLEYAEAEARGILKEYGLYASIRNGGTEYDPSYCWHLSCFNPGLISGIGNINGEAVVIFGLPLFFGVIAMFVFAPILSTLLMCAFIAALVRDARRMSRAENKLKGEEQ